MTYKAVILDTPSKRSVVDIIKEEFGIKEGVDVIGHHMTICMGTDSKNKFPGYVTGEELELEVVAVGRNETNTAVKINPPFPTKNCKKSFAHVTVTVDREAGGKPAHSNKITEWKELDKPVVIKGRVDVIIPISAQQPPPKQQRTCMLLDWREANPRMW